MGEQLCCSINSESHEKPISLYLHNATLTVYRHEWLARLYLLSQISRTDRFPE